jgi:signal transduction histidine kinase/CheY-like chemotaxis protein
MSYWQGFSAWSDDPELGPADRGRPQRSPDEQELRQQLLNNMSLLMALVCGLATWLYLTAKPFVPSQFLVLASLAAWGALAYYYRRQRPDLGRALMLVGPTLSFAVALVVWPGPSVPLFGAAVVVATAVTHPPIGFVAVPLNSLLILLLAREQPTWAGALLVLWLVALIQWVNTQGLYTVLEWSWNSHLRTNHLLSQLRNRQGDLNRTLGALQEATHRLQRTGHELADARLRAQEARRAKERFAANISHELRTPLNLIVGFAETMHLYPDLYGPMEWPGTLRRDVYQIFTSSQQLSELIDDVLDLSRADAQEMPVHRELAGLPEVVMQAASSIRSLIRQKDLVIRTELPADLPLLPIDRTRIRQVLLNLLKNAVRFTDQGEIVVSAVATDHEVTVAVRDTGIGIPEEEQGRIFDEFHQVDLSLYRSEGGFGLGLAISKRFVDLHHGHIWVESQVGQGSTFYFSLPLDPQREGRPLREIDVLAPRPAGKPSLVLLSRESALRSLVERHLLDYDVHLTDDLAQARELVAQHHPEALVLNMDPENALDAAALGAALQAVPPKVPVMACSIPTPAWMARRLGVADCLPKPLEREPLLAVLRRFGPVHKLLIVDDDEGFAELVRRYLAVGGREQRDPGVRMPREVRWAPNGVAALDILRAWQPDLILLDLIMPVMDGFAFIARHAADPALAPIPVVTVTASQFSDELAADHVTYVAIGRAQGFNTAEVIEKLRVLLQVSHAEYPLAGQPAWPESREAGDDAEVW